MKWNPFQPSVEFHIETSHLFCRAKQMTGFYMKHKNGLKWVKNKTLLVRTGRNSFRWPKSLYSQENIFSDHKIVLSPSWPVHFRKLRYHKTFWGTTKKCENKIWVNFSLRPGFGREGSKTCSKATIKAQE